MAATHVRGAAAGTRRQRPVQRGRFGGRAREGGEEAGPTSRGLGAIEEGSRGVGTGRRGGFGFEGGVETRGTVGQYCAEGCRGGKIAVAD